MSHSTQPNSRVPQSEMKHESAKQCDTVASSVSYGTDDLPVLLRLPDLSLATQKPAVTSAERPPTVGGPEAVATGAPKTAARNRRQRRSVRERGRPKASDMQSWFRGVGQVVAAAVVASVLFAMLVAIRGRQSKGPEHDALAVPNMARLTGDSVPADHRLQAAPALAGAEPRLETPDAPRTEPLAEIADSPVATEREVRAAESAVPSGEPQVVETRRESLPNAESTIPLRYPVTDAAPIVVGPPGRAVHSRAGWREMFPSGTFRQARRPQSQADVQKSYGSQTNGPTHEKPRSDLY